jgi:hypothetical protein
MSESPVYARDDFECYFMSTMELYPVRSTFGFPDLFWSVRQWAKKRRSGSWERVAGTVEGYELLLARENGWFVIFYSYTYGSTQYSGESRRWLLFSFSSQETQTGKVMKRFPRGATIAVRVDPQDPAQSVVES